MDKNVLLPCPCCGGSALYQDDNTYHFIVCNVCELQTKLHDDKCSAVMSWNQRLSGLNLENNL
ncbi:Lar family restriction alleviation protein [Dickeya parazeae]|uniref:Lar family restriction alleviation protein n=1 Tax=Dickeya parazeae TaxID=2893572 RepID=UPI001AECFE2E|nr:Lar family restriction alleviation protein [Dickeya parazeae]